MKSHLKKALPLVIAMAVVFVAIAAARMQTKQEPNKTELVIEVPDGVGYVQAHVNAAKKAKVKRVDMAALHGMLPGGDTDMETVAKHSTVIVGEIVGQKTYNHGEALTTYYRFKVLETLLSPGRAINQQVTVPQEQYPVRDGEILVPLNGGTVEIDGVEVHQPVELKGGGRKYLLFVLLRDDGVAVPLGGAASMFTYEGGKLKPASRGRHVLKEYVAALDESLDKVKSDLKGRSRK